MEKKLDEKCSDKHIATIANSLTDWRAFAPYLDLKEVDEDEIEKDGHNEPQKRLRVLRMWISRNGEKATYKQLIAAFERARRNEQAQEVRLLLVPSDGSSEVQMELGEQGSEPVLESMRQPQGSTKDSNGSMSSRQQKSSMKSQIRQSHSATAITPYKDCCCYLKHDGGLHGSGVIVKLTATPKELLSCLPGLKHAVAQCKDQELQTSYVLITCHRIIPGMSDLKGWNLDLGLGKRYKLESLVCGAVSCCGKDGIISSGPNPNDKQSKIFLPHQDTCYLQLDFTMLFLNQKFVKQVSSQIAAPELSLDILEEPISVPDTQLELQLYQRVLVGQEITAVLELDLDQKVQQGLDSSPPRQLRDEIAMNKMFQRICYTCTPGKSREGLSGSPLVYYDPEKGKAHLVGIHVGGTHNTDYYGVTMYEIFQLLKGKLAAFFAIMELELPRRMWPGRWAHLLIHTLAGYVVQENRPSYSYLIEVLHLILRKLEGVQLIDLRIADASELIVEPALQLLTTLFKWFAGSGYDEIEAAILGVFAGDTKAEKEFRMDLNNLSNFLVTYQESKILRENIHLVDTYLKCHNMMLNFKGKDISALLCREDMIDRLKHLREKYTSPEIEQNFNDILMKYHLMKREEYESRLRQELQKQRQELQKRHESQLKEQRQEYELKLTQLREQLEKEIELRQQCEHQQRKNSDSKQLDSQVQQKKETNV